MTTSELRSYPCTNGGAHRAAQVTTFEGSTIDRWVCPDCLMRVSRNAQPMLDDGIPVPWLPITART